MLEKLAKSSSSSDSDVEDSNLDYEDPVSSEDSVEEEGE